MDEAMLMAAAAAAGIDTNGGTQEDKPLSVEEEYNLWKSNVPFLYDFVSETKLVWPSLTLEWLPGAPGSAKQEMVIGTHTSGEEQNYLKIAAINLPEEVVTSNNNIAHNQKETDNEYVTSNIKIVQKFKHEEEITRARFMPQNPNIIATINGKGNIYIFDRVSPARRAIKTLKYHTENGYGLSFNRKVEGRLLSGSDDHSVAMWDIDNSESPIQTWENLHSDIVNDCKWHSFNKDIFGSVSEDKSLLINDIRNNNNKQNSIVKIKTETPFNTIAFSKHSHNLFAAAGEDSNVYLYDMRNANEPLHSMSGHEDAITNLEFYEHEDGIIMSSGMDRRAILWDINEIGAEQVTEDAEDATPEVLMMHAGHRSPINDFSMNPNIPWLMASCEEENIIQVWKCSSKLPKVGGVPPIDESLLK